jgi:hypothetical protein
MALRKLLEAKDCAVRAKLFQTVPEPGKTAPAAADSDKSDTFRR